MRVRLLVYKFLTLVWFVLAVAAMYFVTDGAYKLALTALLAAFLFVALQAMLIRCPHCHARPGLWILAIWTLLLDPELYIADVLLLRTCPHCKRPLVALPAKSSGTSS